MSDIVPHALYFRQQRLDLRQHAIDAVGKMIEVVRDVLHRQPLVDIAFHDPLDTLIDGFHPPPSLAAEPNAGRQDQPDRRNGSHDQCLRDDVRQCRQNTDAAAEDQNAAIRPTAAPRR